MNLVQQLSAVALLIDFLLGVAFGVFGGVVYGSVRDDRARSLLGAAPGPLIAGARAILGVRTHSDLYMRSLLVRRGADNRGGEPIGTESQESGQ